MTDENPRRTPECLFGHHSLCRGPLSGCGCDCHNTAEICQCGAAMVGTPYVLQMRIKPYDYRVFYRYEHDGIDCDFSGLLPKPDENRTHQSLADYLRLVHKPTTDGGREIDGEPVLVCETCRSMCHSRSGLNCHDLDGAWPCGVMLAIMVWENGGPLLDMVPGEVIGSTLHDTNTLTKEHTDGLTETDPRGQLSPRG